jgi:CheY-like chemotaxis protein
MSVGPILVVDDHPINLKLVRVVLQNQGYEVHVAEDAEEAVELLRTIRPRLILMDLQLPGMDGYELTRRLKSAAETRDIPVVAVTSYAMKGDERRAREAGCDGYLSKPIDTEALPGIVAGYLARSERDAAGD